MREMKKEGVSVRMRAIAHLLQITLQRSVFVMVMWSVYVKPKPMQRNKLLSNLPSDVAGEKRWKGW